MKAKKYIDPFAKECNQYALKFDKAFDSEDWESTKSLILECENLLESHSDYSYAPVHYSLGTAYGDLIMHGNQSTDDDTKEKILYHYREALSLLSADELNKEIYRPYINGLKLPLLTNYANMLSKCGRKIAAIRCYRQALKINPAFKMALGNIGVALLHYSMLIHDNGQKDYLNHFAYNYIKSAVEDNSEEVSPNAAEYFKNRLNIYTSEYIENFLEQELPIDRYDLGSLQEMQYRRWCLKNHLFLNPLNDLPLEHSCFAADTLQLPGIITPISQKDIPIYFGMFNQIKQEYIYARYLCYKFQSATEKTHYADKETYLVNLYDYPQYSIRIEDGKTAFRLLYSLFDKVSFFANCYWNLGIKEHDVSFQSIWRKRSGGKNKYQHKSLDTENNISIEAIKWIYKDFNINFGDSKKPESKKLRVLRHSLEHKYVKVHSSMLYDVHAPYVDDEGTYHISEDTLLQYTMELMCMIRELIIDLSMAIHIEEANRKRKDEGSHMVGDLTLYEYEDEWKV